MPSFTPTDFIAATKEQLEARQALWAELTKSTFENVRMLVDLNMQMMRDTLADSSAVTQQLLSARTPQEFVSRSAALGQPNAEKILDYGRHVAEITASIQEQVRKAAQAQLAENKEKLTAKVVKLAHDTPGDSEAVQAMMRSAVEKGRGGYEQWAKTTQQVFDAMQANLNTVANQFAAGANKPPASGGKRKNHR